MKCAVCKSEFTPKKKTQIYCTPECRETARKRKDNEYRKRKIQEGTLHAEVECEICKKTFIQITKLQKVCSDECRDEKAKRRTQHNYTVHLSKKQRDFLDSLGDSKAQFVREAIDEKFKRGENK
jgi:hypothetical protein